MVSGGANNQFASPDYFCIITNQTTDMAYRYDPKTGEFIDTVAPKRTSIPKMVQQVRTVETPRPSAIQSRPHRQNLRTVMSTVYGGTSRYRGYRSEYFRWWILRMCVYVGIAMLFNLCSR